MQILNHNNCAGILIIDQLLDDWVNSPDRPEMTITVKKNCTDLVEIQMTALLYSAIYSGVILTPDALGLGSTIPTGIYTVTIKQISQNVGGATVTDCGLIDCDLKCRVVDYIATNLESPVAIYYETLKYINDCTDCSCASGCLILAEIEAILNNTKTTPCGNCS
jgi:hypothetical protein